MRICRIYGTQNIQEKEKLKSDINVSNERIINNNENYTRYKKEIEELASRNKGLEDEKTQKQEKKERLFANKEKFEKELKEKEEELSKLNAKLTEKEKEIEGKKLEIEKFTDEKYEKLNEINALDITNENIDKRIKTLKYEIQLNISELDNINLAKQDISNVFHEIEDKKNKVQEKIEETLKKKEEEQKNLKEYDTKINSMQSDYRIKESRLKFLIETEKEKEGYSKTVKSLLLACQRIESLGSCSERNFK